MIMSHSFGTVVYVDFLGSLPSQFQTPLRHIMLAGPVTVVAQRAKSSARLVKAIANLVAARSELV